MDVKIVIAIDPGVGGAIVRFNRSSLSMGVSKMPTMKELPNLFRDQMIGVEKGSPEVLVFIEDVSKIWMGNRKPKNDEKDEQEDTVNIGMQYRLQTLINNYKELVSYLQFSSIPHIEVHPRTWQSYLKLFIPKEDKSDRKRRYVTIAQELYPEVKVTHANADALLIAEFGRRKLDNDLSYIRENVKLIEPSFIFS